MKKRPKLRSVNIFPVEVSGKRFLYFRDPLSYAKEIAVPIELIDILRLFDGDHTFEDIQLKLLLSSNARVSVDFIADLALTFDECLLLESEQF
ncbi:MAG: hypothetical protein JNN15_13060, partial [Blastocatellia bacterium]|nr:hypothetical protein [Blastocatellia bacterium]